MSYVRPSKQTNIHELDFTAPKHNVFPDQNDLLVATWNLLYDNSAQRHPMQKDRLELHATTIKTTLGDKTPDILYCCEGASHANLYTLAEKTGLIVVGEPYGYGDNQVMAFMARPEIAADATTEYHEHGAKKMRYGYMVMKMSGVTFIGVHSDSRVLRGMIWRSRASHSIRSNLNPNVPTVLLGDLNAPPWASSRQRIANKLREVHARNRPYIPSPGFRGKSLPIYTPPKWNLDGIFVSSHFIIKASGSTDTNASDHPLLYAQLKFSSDNS